MKSIYIRELRKYSLVELSTLFGLSQEITKKLLKDLKYFNIVKFVSLDEAKKDLSEISEIDLVLDYTMTSVGNYFYVFDFVGIIVCFGLVIKCYPKYIKSNDTPLNEMKQIIKVLQKYNSNVDTICYESDYLIETESTNKLPLILFLLDDYQKNGLYNKSEEIILNDLNNEILWDKTICETDPFFDDDVPYYLDLKSKKKIEDQNNFISCLHKFVLTQCSYELINSELPELFPDLTTAFLSDSKLEDFGDIEYVLSCIEKELNVQFNTQKQIILKSLYAYLSNTKSIIDSESYSFYGTNKFNIVWETICKSILNDKLNVPLKNLGIPKLDTTFIPYMNEKLINLIDKPKWQNPPITSKPLESAHTFIPDIVTIENSKFIIFDAKYYNFVLDATKLEGNPGIESISKQYFYQMAYKDFINLNKFTKFYNCFLFPTEESLIIDKGIVNLGFLRKMMLADIHLKLIPAVLAYEKYLTNNKISLTDLHI